MAKMLSSDCYEAICEHLEMLDEFYDYLGEVAQDPKSKTPQEILRFRGDMADKYNYQRRLVK